MHPLRRRKLQIVCLLLIVFGAVISLILYALRQNISLFYSPTQVIMREAPLNRSIRVGGMVVVGSIVRPMDGLDVQFKITDYKHTISIHYHGILPDLFREGQGIVAQGQWVGTYVNATEVLAKHDENYMPREVRDALKS